MSVIEDALCRVANNVAKHLCNGKAWTVEDKCFRIDLREAEAELEALVAALVAEEREACLGIADYHRTHTSGDLQGKFIAEAIRKRGEA